MKIAVLSYPMLFQTTGGLQVQVQETIAALRALGCDARLIDPNHEHLSKADLVHVFSAINGNQRIVEHAKAFGVPCVISPLIRPYWTRSLGRRAALAERILGRITGWNVATEYRQIATALQLSDHVFALGSIEKRCLIDAFDCRTDRISIIPNGIAERFFASTGEPFCAAYGLQPGYVLSVATINSHKNQLGLARALSGWGVTLVLVGHCLPTDRPYLDALVSVPGVRYIGGMDYESPLLASAYAGAAVFCLTSDTEVMPLTVLEALAAGTPAVVTRHHCMDIEGMRPYIKEVEPTSPEQIRKAVLACLPEQPVARERASACVQHLRWSEVGRQILSVYHKVLSQQEHPLSN